MLMIFEILLTVAAWKKGYKWFALIPLAFTVFIAFGGGFVAGAMGGPLENILPYFLFLDVFCILVLVIMLAIPIGARPKPVVPTAIGVPPLSSYGNVDEVRRY